MNKRIGSNHTQNIMLPKAEMLNHVKQFHQKELLTKQSAKKISDKYPKNPRKTTQSNARVI